MEENYFSDEGIIEQSAAMVQRKDGSKTNGISILVACPPNAGAVEVVLERDELKAALAELQADRDAMPHLYEAAASASLIDTLVDKFLAWPLPDTVCADLCATRHGEPHRCGTNLLTAVEARQMLEYLLKDTNN